MISSRSSCSVRMRGRVGAQDALRLVDDHPEELLAVVRGGQPAGDPEDGVEALGELRLESRVRHRPSRADRLRDLGHAVVADDAPEDRAARRRPGSMGRRRGRGRPGRSGRWIGDHRARAHGPMVAPRAPVTPSRHRSRVRGMTIGGPVHSLTVQTPRTTLGARRGPSRPRPSRSRMRGQHSPWTTVPVPSAPSAPAQHQEPGSSRLLTADRDPRGRATGGRDVPLARWHPCST